MTKKTRTILAISAAALAVLLVAVLLLRNKPAGFEPELMNREVDQGGGIAEFIKVKIFFLSETSPYLQPVFREIEVPEIREELYKKFIALLLAGDSGHITPVPGGVQLRSLHYLGAREMLLLDFNEPLASAFPGGTSAELATFMRVESARYEKIVKEENLKAR
jgi:hypothetical protein